MSPVVAYGPALCWVDRVNFIDKVDFFLRDLWGKRMLLFLIDFSRESLSATSLYCVLKFDTLEILLSSAKEIS